MMRTVFASWLVWLAVACSRCSGYIEHPGPRYAPTKGEVWPKPQEQIYYDEQLTLSPDNFKFEDISTFTCPTLNVQMLRYYELLKTQWPTFRKAKRQGRPASRTLTPFTVLYVNLTQRCSQVPSENMSEEYYLEVNSPTVLPGTGALISDSLWGIVRGLETFSQLIFRDRQVSRDLVINSTSIHDFPRFSHRGLLLDTSRHFITVDNILKILDGMTYNKLNVFHWHIVDDQSFPYVSKVFPTLSEKGAYHPRLVYSPEQVSEVIEYARERGIRVMPEFDTPGHTRSWGEAFPKLLTECYGADGKPNGDLGPINPAEEFVYTFMKDLLKEVNKIFYDNYIHLGGDEVGFECWQSSPKITEFMHNNNIVDYAGLEELYIQKIVDIVEQLNSKSVVWQEVYLNGVRLPKGTVVHVWTGNQRELLQNITASGYPALLSTCWYLDHLDTGGDWQKFYNCDPRDFLASDSQKKLVLGGEACMWSEVVDDNNVLSRIFPRASAAAEKLWSAETVKDIYEARHRIEEHTCRLIARGVPAQPPSGPGFCIP